ncbi:MAG TPA: AmmeMemoRadiSam system protein A [Deltaproteobacteria bacterium]|jgi:AmmeMemoRadiSam system protein A|nr:AmmeMemoRadiSam system protein A [Deltaproteobacteria bacterium]HOI06793.1 AmmeMemoRadiSam system protein A [Deltaproteobacteria bacterium]
MEGRFSREHGLALVRMARETIETSLGIRSGEDDPEDALLNDAVMESKHGVFVTLTKDGDLRGCIGFLEGRESVKDAVRHNALNAAFNDPRFPPLRASEVGDIDIEVSILTDPEPLDYSGPSDLLNRLRPGIDGVIIRSGLHAATFLPQVWDQLPDKEDFLDHLCLKAGLPARAWKRGDLEVLTYQVQHFEEER